MLKVVVLLLFLSVVAYADNGSKIEAWKTRPRGANVFSEISDSDLHFASGNKIRFLRIGAVGQHQDLRWLIKNDRFDLSEKNEAKLKSKVSNLTKKGFLVILSLSELPGRRWRFGEKDFRIWENSKFQDEFVSGWRKLAKLLKDDAGLIGYDLMNEPYFKKALRDFVWVKIGHFLQVLFKAPVVSTSGFSVSSILRHAIRTLGAERPGSCC